MRVLIDTCIIVDFLQKREPFFKNSHIIFLAVANYSFDGYITAKSVADIYYIMHHYFHDNNKTRIEIEKLFKLFGVLDTTEFDCKKALLSPISDYEDALMVETSVRNNLDCIVTRNASDYLKSPIKTYSPTEFLKLL
ncbi:MAG: PIN domain-containing protein [Candidatus Riflebacteria bacterium]|jgi:predicted nucleic acid-binding protein|nr:PIN domain-containing protein [Candidatus Riflebacteria bacterium]MBR4330284.1 PIN domain-containing protein [Candidatus Riflebacteria bacterium]